jgi:hypothetical protein
MGALESIFRSRLGQAVATRAGLPEPPTLRDGPRRAHAGHLRPHRERRGPTRIG